MDKTLKKRFSRQRIHWRIRKKIFGTPERPRACVRKTLKHIYVQVVDDTTGHCLVQCSTLDPEVRGVIRYGGNQAAAKVVGEVLGKRLKEAGIEKIAFDRGGHRYHGRVRVLAEAIRQQGIQF